MRNTASCGARQRVRCRETRAHARITGMTNGEEDARLASSRTMLMKLYEEVSFRF